jgi:hypothetical protein
VNRLLHFALACDGLNRLDRALALNGHQTTFSRSSERLRGDKRDDVRVVEEAFDDAGICYPAVSEDLGPKRLRDMRRIKEFVNRRCCQIIGL